MFSKKSFSLAALYLLIASASPACISAHAASGPSEENPAAAPANKKSTASKVTGLIVKFRQSGISENASAASIKKMGIMRAATVNSVAAAHGFNATYGRRLATGGDLFRLNRPATPAEARVIANELKKKNPDVEYAEPDFIMQKMDLVTPNDPLFSQQWDMVSGPGGVNAQNAWSITQGQGAVVAVLDTGVRPHPDLLANLLPGYNFVSDPAMGGNGRGPDATDPGDGSCPGSTEASSWHGTHVSGTIAAAANNGIGIAGVAPQAKILPVRVLGCGGGKTSDIVDAMVWAAGGTVAGVPANVTPVKAMNLSLGAEIPCLKSYNAAIAQVNGLGAAVIVAAGNASHNARNSAPASCPNALTVAAVGKTGARASYSNYGAMVVVAAPGGDGANGIMSTWNDGTAGPGNDVYGSMVGTSMATPHVTGVAALMLAANPKLTAAQIRSILIKSVRSAPDACPACGAGLVDAAAAVTAAQNQK